MLTAEGTLRVARQQMAVLLARAASQRITLLLAVGGGFDAAGPESQPPVKEAMR